MKTIFITIFQGFISRSILGTEAFQKLAANKNLRIVLLVPEFKLDYYRRNFGSDNVVIEGIDDQKLRGLSTTRLQKLAILLLPTYFVRYRIKSKLSERRYLNYFLSAAINYLLGPLKIVHKIFRFFDHIFTHDDLFDAYFKKYQPTLVFSTDIFSPSDTTLLLAAKKYHSKSIGMVRSWDCTTNKNLLRVIPSQIAVNNTIVGAELVKYHDVTPSKITPVGFPQFDPFINLKADPRDVFYTKIGADPNKRLILFAPAGSDLSDIDEQYCDILNKALEQNKIPNDIQFLVRKHPQDRTNLSAFEGNKNFIIEQPGISFSGLARASEIDHEATQHLINSIFHSDLVISVNTSLGLDAVIFDKPHIMLGFDGYEQKPFLKSVRRYQREDNMWGFIKTGAVRVAKNPEELILWINKYLQEPTIDSSGREKARRDILYKLDGKSGERVAAFVLNQL